ncbi:hypothetical protein K435DRAFT_833781 [Dendrothele bispora CBS 962.96]|uniref:R3H domain-containing protein n=1 Tax=Dendrothele bispora (strain CBS 962.96) TaxID=1314807 RepID=A0A4V4HIL8_DENBC|nr:hypothetical protein K435DRAFT_833781 [Dendrothele bispora CBS 962.96]
MESAPTSTSTSVSTPQTHSQIQSQSEHPRQQQQQRRKPRNNPRPRPANPTSHTANTNTANTNTTEENGQPNRRPKKPRVKEDKSGGNNTNPGDNGRDKGKEKERLGPSKPRRGAKFNPSLTTTTTDAKQESEGGGSSSSSRRNRFRNNYKRPALPDTGADDLTSNLIRGLSRAPYADCPICFNAIYPPQAIWTCSPLIPILSDDSEGENERKEVEYCYTPFHLKCIRPWAEKSFNDVKAAWEARGEPERGGEWRCPGCQGRRNRLVGRYTCFCGATPNPPNPTNRLFTPHSCGNPCSRARVASSRSHASCTHPCPLLCHPGPCPPCKVTIELKCNCPRQRVIAIKCSDVVSSSNSSTSPQAQVVSCGEPCGKSLNCSKPDSHFCMRTCHEGPCEPCKETEVRMCWCRKTERVSMCGDLGEGEEVDKGREEDGWDGCGLDSVLPGTVGGNEDVSRKMRKGFSCSQTCAKPFDCGVHTCQRVCHPSLNPDEKRLHCPLSPDVVQTCPCGKRGISPSTLTNANAKDSSNLFPARTSCTSPIPTCGATCLKPRSRLGNKGCDHPCQHPCHTGPCPPCKVEVVRPCRCGGTRVKVECGSVTAGTSGDNGVKEILCDRPCLALRSCGRHQCGRVCCPLGAITSSAAAAAASSSSSTSARRNANAMNPNDLEDLLGLDPALQVLHECSLTCGKMLSCGNHACEEKDHKGPCKPCLRSSFDELTCFCGQTTMDPPIPCGTTLADLHCPYPCPLPPPPCGHPKAPHTCHPPSTSSTNNTNGCPPCIYLTAKPCSCGKKTIPNVKCSLDNEKVKCGMVCGKRLDCGVQGHVCERVCHSGECGSGVGNGEGKRKGGGCGRVCGKGRRGCLPAHHPCTSPCHAPSACPEDTPCQSVISITCPCGRIKQSVLCGKSSTSQGQDTSQGQERGNSQRELKCTSECEIAKRNRRLAEALGIDTSARQAQRGGSGGADTGGVGGAGADYNDELVTFGRKENAKGKFLGIVEKAFTDFVVSNKKSQVLPSMPPDRRKFVHDLASVYRMDTQMVDQEPYRSVQIIRRIDTRIPTPTLSAYITSLGSQGSSASLGKLTDMKLGSTTGSGIGSSSTPSWRSGAAATSSTTSSVGNKVPTNSVMGNRGWTSVVAQRPGATIPGVGTSSGPSSGTVTPWNSISRAGTPHQGQAQGGGSGNRVTGGSAAAHRSKTPNTSTSTTQTPPPVDDEPVPDDWEDDA